MLYIFLCATIYVNINFLEHFLLCCDCEIWRLIIRCLYEKLTYVECVREYKKKKGTYSQRIPQSFNFKHFDILMISAQKNKRANSRFFGGKVSKKTQQKEVSKNNLEDSTGEAEDEQAADDANTTLVSALVSIFPFLR